ncbi:hypothetical protein ES703_43519 [subsurface metagenome]
MARNLAEAIKTMNEEDYENLIFQVHGRINAKNREEACGELKTRGRTVYGLETMLKEFREQVDFGTDLLVIHIIREGIE